VTPTEIPNVEAGIFTQCQRCQRWWHKAADGTVSGPVTGVTGGPPMRDWCSLCLAEIQA